MRVELCSLQDQSRTFSLWRSEQRVPVSLCVPAEKRSPYIRQTAFVVLSAVLDRSKGTDRGPEEI